MPSNIDKVDNYLFGMDICFRLHCIFISRYFVHHLSAFCEYFIITSCSFSVWLAQTVHVLDVCQVHHLVNKLA